MTYKIEKRYRVIKKFGALVTLLFFFIFFVGSLLMIEIFFDKPLGNYWFIPLSITLLIFIALLFVKDLLLFFKIWMGYNTVISFLTIVLFTLEIIYLSVPLICYFKVAIYFFLLLLWSALIYDIKNAFSSFQSKNIEYNINKNLRAIEKNSTLELFYANIALKKDNYRENKTIMLKILFFFGLPFVLLGKGASYFMVLVIGEYFSVEEYIFIFLGFILMMFMFLIVFLNFSLIVVRLKYKNNDK